MNLRSKKELIIKYINEKKVNFTTYEKLKHAFQDIDLDKILKELLRDGLLIQQKNKFYVNKEDPEIGEILTKKNGIKIVKTKEAKEIPLSSDTQSKYLKNDIVKFYVVNHEAHPFELVKRTNNKKVFQVVKKDGNKMLEYTQGEYEIHVPKDALEDYIPGEYVLVDISDNEFNGIIKRILNTSNTPIRDRIIAYNYGFEDDYNDAYLKELSEIPQEVSIDEIKNRIDYRNDNVFTIDCDNTKDMDDAVSIKKLPNGNYELITHIASVSEYVKFDSTIFHSAMHRGNSLYTARSVFPMFHYLLSNGICSLNPNVDRLTKSLTLEIDRFGNVIRKELNYGVINSKIKMAYSEVDKILSNEENIKEEYLPYIEDLKLMKELSDIMGENLKRHGKMEFANQEWEVILDENGKAIDCVKLQSPISRKLIENFMLYTNWQWATLLEENGFPICYRIHEASDDEKIESAINKLQNLGFDISGYKKTKNLHSLLERYANSPDEYNVISNTILGAYNKAEFSPNNIGHFGVGLPIYAQFTSDIRRSCDLYNHYSSDAYLTKNPKDLKKLKEIIELTCSWATFKERQADKAEKEALDYDLLEIASHNIGNTFEGAISEIRNGKTYIRLDNGVYAIVTNNNNNLTPGTRVIARIDSVNPNKKEIQVTYQEIIKRHSNHKKKVKTR